ncbi:MAG: PAS domain-containing protein [Bifidobacteriaceae bacterium]|jgi:DUF438 domain-containing protein|nr:PAS domain-containing protein [Bifidobacteriaceae bacterium]
MPTQKPYLDNADVYINFPTGRLSLTEVQQIFSTIPFELDLIDRTDHFAWYSDKPNREHVRSLDQVGETVEQCHPARVLPHVMGIINSFKDGSKDVVRVPLYMHGHRSLIQYYALRDVDGTYLGTIEFTGSVEDILGFYENGAWSQSAPTAGAPVTSDATSGASDSSASVEEPAPAASVPETPVDVGVPDASSGASESSSLDEDPATSESVNTEPAAVPDPVASAPGETFTPDATSGASDTDYPSAEESSAATGMPASPEPEATTPAFMTSTPDATSGASQTPTDADSSETSGPAQSAPVVPQLPDLPKVERQPGKDERDAYIKFPTGRLTLAEVQQIFSTIPFELDLIDHTDHFTWFSNKPNREHVRSVDALGETVEQCHPARVLPHVMGIINSFKDGSKDVVKVPLVMNGHRVLIQYYALRDVDGAYLGTIEFTGSVEYILNFFDQGAWSQSTPGAAAEDTAAPDATSGASQSDAAPAEPEQTSPAFGSDSSDASSADSAESPFVAPFTPDASSGASQTTDSDDTGSPDTDSDGTVGEDTPTPSASPAADESTPDATTGASAYGA